jgi:CelD/BcsL family acetyltransferase involved in cellulose biosynthesis
MIWQIAHAPQPALAHWSAQAGRLFAHPQWAQVLAPLGCTPLYVWHAARAWGAMVPVFQRAGVRVGFLGFPVCDPECPIDGVVAMRALARACGVHVMRVVTPMRHARVGALPATAELPDAWISDLAKWPGELEKRTRRHLAQAAKRCVDMQLAFDGTDADAAHALYAATLARHGGTQRYNAEYFRALFDLARADMGVSTLCASLRGAVCAFVVTARDGDTVYYLHGGLAPQARETYVFDLLMRKQIERARATGAKRFDFMASPRSQPSLLRFKSKWCDQLGWVTTSDVGRGPIGAPLAAWLRWRGRSQRGELPVLPADQGL